MHRWVAARPGEWLVVADDVRAFGRSELVQWFQFAPDADLRRAGDRLEVRFPWTDDVLHVFSLSSGHAMDTYRGERDGEQWNGWYSPAYHELLPSWQIGFREHGMRARFVTVFRWIADGAPGEEQGGWRESGWCTGPGTGGLAGVQSAVLSVLLGGR
jgi:hypothetical protein